MASTLVRSTLAILAALALAACPDCDGPGDDGGAPDDDGGLPHDSGAPSDDGGPTPDDGGPAPDDGGPPPDDGGAPPDDGGSSPDAGGLPPFAYADSCTLGLTAPAPEYDVVDAFPDLPSFSNAVFATHAGDGSGRLFVVQQGGVIWSFANDEGVTARTQFLDITGRLESGGEKGLLGLAFHPDFATNGFFYVNYTKREGSLYTIVSRFSVSSGDPAYAEDTSELEILRVAQPYENHNGGMIAFGPDGYLYIGMGDGGSGGDPQDNGQDTTTLLGALLRIDVDNPQGGDEYGIPADNPFAGGAGGNAPEIYAWGLRNPWRFSFDRETDDLWIGDVGQGDWEEIDFVTRARLDAGLRPNFGWNTLEGFECFGGGSCSTDGLEPPLLVYDHGTGYSVTGGYRYRGGAVPSLEGKYLYGDYVTRLVWAYDVESGAGATTPIFTASQGLSSFAEDEDGEVYLVGHGSGGRLWRIVENIGPPVGAPPALLSQTGCFTDLATLEPAQGVVHYDVNMELWSDNTAKERYFVLPDGEQLGFDESGPWTAPYGTLFIKNFFMDTTWGDPATRVRLETRFLWQGAGEVRAFSYRWRDDGSDADLLAAGDSRDLTITREAGGSSESYTWVFPSPAQCLQCHTQEAGGFLGPSTAQLNRDHGYGGVDVNQLAAYIAWELLEPPPATPPAGLPRFPSLDDETSPVGERARAWLQANCAHCHLPGGATGRNIDLRATTPLADMQVCDVAPQGWDYGLPGARIVKPGNPDESLLYYRATQAAGRMPPLGTSIVDDVAADVKRRWIESLADCTE